MRNAEKGGCCELGPDGTLQLRIGLDIDATCGLILNDAFLNLTSAINQGTYQDDDGAVFDEGST
jgi:hypothetical protein